MGSSMTPSSPIKTPHKSSNYDELLMQHSLNFAHSLKDLKDLQEQLYSAAEYFELSYSKDDHKQLLIETFKEYATKALVSTVDHLGSVASKLNDFLEEKAGEVSATKLRFSSIEERIHTCQEFIDLGSHAQQSLLIGTPKHHKQYIVSGGKVNAIEIPESAHANHKPYSQDNLYRTNPAFQATRSQSLPPLPRRGQSTLSSNGFSSSPSMLTFMKLTSKKEQGKHSVSPFRFSLKRAKSAINRSSSPGSSHNSPRTPSEPRRSIIMGLNTDKNKEEEMAFYARKSKHLLKALLSIHKSKKEGVPSRFGDDR